MKLDVPYGLSGIIATFGELEIVNGQLTARWERKNLDFFPVAYDLLYQTGIPGPPLVVNKIYCHRKLGPVFQEVFEEIRQRGLAEEAKEYGGCFNFRTIKGSKQKRLSTHSWGIAIDINPSTNPIGYPSTQHPEVVEIFKRAGFVWGGDFKRMDPMHFQFAKGY